MSRSPSRSRSKGRDVGRRSRSRSRSRRRRSYSRSKSPDLEGHRLHIAELDYRAEKRDLEKLFGRYGPLLEIWMARSSPCFAFVVFRYKDDALNACRAVDGEELCGRRIRVTVARPRTKGDGRKGFDSNMRCYQCGERGHFARDCSDFEYGYKRPLSQRERQRKSRSRSRSFRRTRCTSHPRNRSGSR